MSVEQHRLDQREMIRLLTKAWDQENPSCEMRGICVALQFAPFTNEFSAMVTVGPVAEVVLATSKKPTP